MASGLQVCSDAPLEEADLSDLAPTILHLHGCVEPEDTDSRALTELPLDRDQITPTQESGPEQAGEQRLSPVKALALQDRLNDLGSWVGRSRHG